MGGIVAVALIAGKPEETTTASGEASFAAQRGGKPRRD